MQMEIKNLDNHKDRWVDGNWSKQELIDFENDIISHWENGEITGPIHLSNGNEEPLIDIFKKIGVGDWVFSTWRSHYHALLHGVDPKFLKQKILEGKSITIIDKESNFYSSAIVTGILPIALGVAKGIKEKVYNSVSIELLGNIDKLFVTQVVTNPSIFSDDKYTLSNLIRDYLNLRLMGLLKR